jgi:hypothetical protein
MFCATTTSKGLNDDEHSSASLTQAHLVNAGFITWQLLLKSLNSYFLCNISFIMYENIPYYKVWLYPANIPKIPPHNVCLYLI